MGASALTVRGKAGEAAGAELHSFAPRDGLICYQGPKDAMTELYNKVRQGPDQLMFVNSMLWNSPCRKQGFTDGFLGQTCYGETFTNTKNLAPHVFDERSYDARFRQEHTEAEYKAAQQAVSGCASCHPHC